MVSSATVTWISCFQATLKTYHPGLAHPVFEGLPRQALFSFVVMY